MSRRKQFAIFGLGRFGANLALTLEEMGYSVLGVDKDESVTAGLARKLPHVVSFDIRDIEAMRQANIPGFDSVVISTKTLESSLMATMLCKEFGIPEIVVKAIDERHAEMAKKLGATNVIFSERDTARRTALHLVSPHAVDHISLDANINILSTEVPKSIIGQSLIDANLRVDYNVNIIAIKRQDTTIVTPPPTHEFREGDRLFLIGTPAALAHFEEAMRE